MVITKVDMVPEEQLKKISDTVTSVLKSAGAAKVPMVVESSDDCITAASTSLNSDVVPVFRVSSLSGAGLADIKQYLHLLPPGVGQSEANRLDQELPEFQIDELFHVPGVGTVAGGLVTQGIIVENMPLNVGPFEDGSFKTVHVRVKIFKSHGEKYLLRCRASGVTKLRVGWCGRSRARPWRWTSRCPSCGAAWWPSAPRATSQ